MDDKHRMHRTVHARSPWSGGPLCGYEEDQSALPEDAPVAPCPECGARLRSGVLTGPWPPRPAGGQEP